MIKNILYIILVVCSLNASEQNMQNQPKATELEMFLFKIGFTSLLEDFGTEKNNIKLNTTDINELKANVQYILQQMNKNKLQEITPKIQGQSDNIKLMQEIEKLKKDIRLLKKQKTTQTLPKRKIYKNTIQQAKLVVNQSTIRVKPSYDSQVIRTINRNTILTIISCNKFSWCRISDGGYIAKLKLKFID